MRQSTEEKLMSFYYYEVPEYIKDATLNSLTISIDGGSELKIAMDDVVEYYSTQANNIVSGMRSIAGCYGDWRPIDRLANEVLEWFKFANINELRRESRKAGLEPKF